MPLRNANSLFATVPTSHMSRSVIPRKSKHITSFNIGSVIPVYVDSDILPGDTVKMTVSKIVRLQTLLTPILDDIVCDLIWVFIPHRLVWYHWVNFNGENTQSAWVPQTTYRVPCISAPSGGFATGTIADYFGWPVGVNWNTQAEAAPNVLALRAYALACNFLLRDENLTDPLNIPVGDSNQTGTNGSNYINDVANGGMPYIAPKLHDRLTSCLPDAQKSAQPVTFPLISGKMAPVGTTDANIVASTTFGKHSLSWKPVLDSFNFSANTKYVPNISVFNSDTSYGVQNLQATTNTGPIANSNIYPSNLWADLSTTVGTVTVNQLRLAFQLQRYYEKLARSGSRYTETIRTFYGIVSPDARLQNPEYLGGNRVPLQISEVVNHAQTQNDFLGDLGATSKTGDVDTPFIKSFTEHGTLLGLCVCRYMHSYMGLEDQFLRRDLMDFYNPTFANIGEQPVFKVALYPDATNMATKKVFGFQEAWSSYRYKENRITGEMRPGIQNSLAQWHLGDYYTQEPTLSDAWIREDKTNVDRVLAVTSANSNQVFADFWFDAQYTRVMPVRSVPGLIDHN